MVSQSLTALMFRRLGFRPWLLGLMAATGLITEALAGPSWQAAGLTRGNCRRRAWNARRQLTKAGYQRLERTEQSRYGTADDYTVAIRCVTDNEIAFLVASGSSRDKTDRLAGELLQYFGTGLK